MLLLFIFLRICLDKILKAHPYGNNVDFITAFLIFSSQSLIGFFIYHFYSKKVYFQERPSQKKYIQSVKDSIALSSINIKTDNKEKYDKIKLICLINYIY